MTLEQFIAKWQANTRNERAAYVEHFNDLCRLLNEPTPNEADPEGRHYAFEKGALKTAGTRGFADVWKRGHFAMEYKGRGADLRPAFDQLQRYTLSLDNPPLLAACNFDKIAIRTAWTNYRSEIHEIPLDAMRDPRELRKLKWLLSDPERLRPGQTREALTAEAAADFVDLARRLRARGHDPFAVAHFINRIVFCLFADKAGLLPAGLIGKMLATSHRSPDRFPKLAGQLFAAMRTGGEVGMDAIEWFNGGLFDSDAALPLTAQDIRTLQAAAERDWADIEPSIFGTLFERGLDPEKEKQIGAHYTDAAKIALIIEPCIQRPLRAEWQAARMRIAGLMEEAAALEAVDAGAAAAALAARQESRGVLPAKQRAALTKAAGARKAQATAKRTEAAQALEAHLARLRAFRVLDPACGSGNFLYVSLMALKDLERQALVEAEALGLPPQPARIGPEVVRGIELNAFAAELARVSVWIGAIQWTQRHGYQVSDNPILKPLETIEHRDALLDEEGKPAEWPKADAIVGNPPFLGGKRLRTELGDANVDALFAAYRGRVPPEADLVCYWFEKSRESIEKGWASCAGLVTTNSIRGGANRRVMDRIRETGAITDAHSDESWSVEGAAVRVSLVCFTGSTNAPAHLDGKAVAEIFSDLTASVGLDLTRAVGLTANTGVAFMGVTPAGSFDIPGLLARSMLEQPRNPGGRLNSEVVKPYLNALDVTRRNRDVWTIDFGYEKTESDAQQYILPFSHVKRTVFALRQDNARQSYKNYWWRYAEPRVNLRRAIETMDRFMVTPMVSRYRIFTWVHKPAIPANLLNVIARDDDTTFGILHSRFHESWSLRLGTWLGVGNDPRYTPTTTFETFPFPEGLTPDLPAAGYAADPRAIAIAEAAKALVEARDAWLNPPEWVERVPEVVPGYPDRLIPRPGHERDLRARTLTNLYNTRGTPEGAWLDTLHARLDAAVAQAYGWPADITEEDALARLLALNQARAPR
ncbi:class I SAM-dependent DNA methyltransferase [Falsiroseomonas ponticola]|uniref:class I SAM-dependent DNA methyltransferase n=1 Tax=Falsiroseomonas ponticola TaxID=2786951 RepID=UPI00193483FB|nr:class I SAM-dependent DNA methyltransferase [Roseomonas ponticola]